MSKKVQLTPIYVDVIPDHKDMRDRELYVSKKYKTAIHLCACGCGELTVTPFYKDGWTLFEKDNMVSISPSVYNKGMVCQSHYWIKDNVAEFC